MTRAPCPGRAERRVEPGRAGPDDGQLGLDSLHLGGTVLRDGLLPRRFLSHPSSLEHDTGPHPEQPARMVAVERAMARSDWLGYERVASPPRRDRGSDCGAPGRARGDDRGRGARGRGADRRRHGGQPGLVHGGAARAGGAVALVDGLLDARLAPGSFSAHRPPGHHAERAGRWASACSTTSPWPRAHALRAGSGAGADPRLGRPPRQRHRGDLRTMTRASCSCPSTSRRCTRGPGRRLDGARRRGGLHGQPAGGGRGRRRDLRSLVEGVACPWLGRMSPSWSCLGRLRCACRGPAGRRQGDRRAATAHGRHGA